MEAIPSDGPSARHSRGARAASVVDRRFCGGGRLGLLRGRLESILPGLLVAALRGVLSPAPAFHRGSFYGPAHSLAAVRLRTHGPDAERGTPRNFLFTLVSPL